MSNVITTTLTSTPAALPFPASAASADVTSGAAFGPAVGTWGARVRVGELISPFASAVRPYQASADAAALLRVAVHGTDVDRLNCMAAKQGAPPRGEPR